MASILSSIRDGASALYGSLSGGAASVYGWASRLTGKSEETAAAVDDVAGTTIVPPEAPLGALTGDELVAELVEHPEITLETFHNLPEYKEFLIYLADVSNKEAAQFTRGLVEHYIEWVLEVKRPLNAEEKAQFGDYIRREAAVKEVILGSGEKFQDLWRAVAKRPAQHELMKLLPLSVIESSAAAFTAVYDTDDE